MRDIDAWMAMKMTMVENFRFFFGEEEDLRRTIKESLRRLFQMLSWRKKGYAMPKSRRQYNNSSRCIVSFALDLTLPLSVIFAAAASHGRGGCGGGGGSAPREGAHEAGHGF